MTTRDEVAPDQGQVVKPKRVWPIDVATILASTIAATAITAAFMHRFFYVDDTESSLAGVWWTLGTRILEGNFAFLSLTTWTSGNILVEGQWGVFNPLVVAFSLGATLAGDLVLYALLLKLAFLCLLGVGMYFLALEYESGRRTAVIVGCLLPLGGFTTYMDAASWATGLFAFAFFPWLWLALIKLWRGKWGLFPAAGFIALVITVGYVHPVIMAAMLLSAFLLPALWRRRWDQVRDYAVLGVFLGLVSVPVFAPALLSASVTNRSSTGISSTGFWSPDISDLLTAASIGPGTEIPNWAGATMPVPLFYIAWFLPVLAVGITKRVRSTPDLIVPGLFGLLVLVLMLGPSEVGPLRFPARVLPYWALAVLVALVIGAKDQQVVGLRGMDRSRRMLSLAWLPVLGTFLAFADSPGLVLGQAVGLIAVLAGLGAWYAAARRGAGHTAVVGLFVIITLVLTVVTRWAAPHPPLTDYGLPGEVQRLQAPLAGLEGQTFVVGNMEGQSIPSLWESTSMGRAWELNPVPVQNSYTIIGFQAYVDDVLTDYHGLTPGVTLDRLFAPDPTTDMPPVDLMAIQNLQLLRVSLPDRDLMDPPKGWKVASADEVAVVWSREEQAPPLGTATWTSDQVSTEVVSNTADSLTMRVRNDSSQLGTVVLSRLAWPGYSVSGDASITDPLRGYLLTVAVPAGAEDSEITLSFVPPGFRIGLLTTVLALMLLGVVEVIRRRRSSKRGSPRRSDGSSDLGR